MVVLSEGMGGNCHGGDGSVEEEQAVVEVAVLVVW